MSDAQFRHYIETIQQHLAALQGDAKAREEVAAALDGLQLIYEEMQASLEAAEVVEQEILQQNQQIATAYQQYHELFHAAPIAYLVTDANGMILEANQAIAQLLNVPQRYLVGKPLSVYVAQGERFAFRTQLNQLSHSSGIQVWQLTLSPRGGTPFAVELHIDAVRSEAGPDAGLIKELRIEVHIPSPSRPLMPLAQQPDLEETRTEAHTPMLQLPQSLDGLRVLVVDDEADIREFITAVLESYGIGVRAVASAAAALEALEQFHPDVLMSDIRMPGGDGYSLIRQIRALEAGRGGYIPAAAITAYLEEDQKTAQDAGFEAHLYKLAQPSEWVELVVQLAGRALDGERDPLE